MNLLKCGKHRLLTRKMLIAMKLTFLFLTVAFLQVSAKSFSQKITLFGKNMPLEKVFAEIKKQSEYVVFFDYDLLKQTRPVTINMKDATIQQVMEECLKGQPLSYTIENKTIVIIKKQATNDKVETIEVIGPPIDIKGRVVNEKGEPVEGVTVAVKGTNLVTFTNNYGEFSLKGLNNDAVLLFTGTNVETFEIKLNGRSELNISLKTKISSLNEVTVKVNTGYEMINKERFVGSYSQLDSQNYHRRVGMNIIDRLDGMVPGIFFNKKGGSNVQNIQIRGISTLGYENTSTAPLVVVDNFPIGNFDINNINPNDVESITVLKDAAAASIWGTQAGAGVIIITTKKGKYNQRFRLDVSSNITIENKPDLFYFKRVSPSDFITIETNLFNQGFYDGGDFLSNMFTYPVISPVVEILDKRRNGLISAADSAAQINALRQYDVRNDLNNHIYRQAVRQQHYVSFSGGNNLLAYQFSAGYNRSLNNIEGAKGDDQYTINTNASFRPVANLEIQTGINLSLSQNKGYNFNPTNLFPYSRFVDDNGNALAIPWKYRMGYIDTAGAGMLSDWHYRPMDEIRLADINNTTRFIALKLGLNYQFTNWLKAQVQYQYQVSSSETSNYMSDQTFATRDLINTFANPSTSDPNLRYPVPLGGILDRGNTLIKNYNLRGTLNINKSWGTDHQLTGMAGAEVSDSKGSYGSFQRLYGYNDNTGTYRSNMDYFQVYPLTYAAYPFSSNFIPRNEGYAELDINRFVSLLANAAYTYKSRYTIYVSGRKDGSNVFGVNTNNKWKPLWSAGAGWEISKEKFYNVNWLSFLKLRGSYGYTGNVNNRLSGKFVIADFGSNDFFTGLPYAQPGMAPNPDLRWEEVRIVNIGVDFQALHNRISGSFELFRKRSKDVISLFPMPPSSGVGFFTMNGASMKIKGFELSLNSQNTKGLIGWTTNFGLSYSKTIITDVYTTRGYKAQDFIQFGLNAVPGRIAFGLSSYRWAGLDPVTGDPQGYYNKQVSKDYNAILNDSIQNQVFHGSTIPLYSAFLRNNITWKGFTLSANITGRFNYYFREPSLSINYSATMDGTNYMAEYYDRWQKPGDEKTTNVPSITYPSPADASNRNTFYQYSEIHVKRGDNIRLQDIRLSYQWNNKNLKRIPVQGMQFFFYPNNLNIILWRAEESHYDPDFSGNDSAPTAAPIPKTWTAGITVNL